MTGICSQQVHDVHWDVGDKIMMQMLRYTGRELVLYRMQRRMEGKKKREIYIYT